VDVALYRSRAPRPRYWPNSTKLIGFRPLSRIAIEDACDRVDRRWAELDLPDNQALHDQAEAAEVLELALCRPERPFEPIGTAQELLEALEPEELFHLADLWFDVQNDSSPEQRKLEAELELRNVEKDQLVYGQVLNAGQCSTAAEFYGEPIEQLTDGQLSYFFSLQLVHNRAYGDTGDKTRCISLSHLRKQAGRSGTTNPKRETLSRFRGQERKRRSA
jgi:hypothetical protein